MPKGFSAKLPLSYSKSEGPYLLTKTLEENARQNLKTLIFTIPGERVMNSDFGVGFSTLLFENANNEVVENLRERLISQVAKYLPFIIITDVQADIQENTAFLKVEYNIPNISISSTLELDIKNNFG
jgi:phage baseplate assembly protein W